MDHTCWHKQTPDKPLFPDLLWSRPENKRQAGKLLIIGGNAHGFTAPAEAFVAAENAGIGTARVLLPDSLQKTVGRIFLSRRVCAQYAKRQFLPESSGGVTRDAKWADGVLLAGDFGSQHRNRHFA